MTRRSVQIVLGIESSCDETGVAIYHAKHGIIAQSLYSQVSLHQRYGGVVPELAARDHMSRVLELVQQTLDQVNYTLKDIDGIAYTAGPGLLGALMVGASFARSLAFSLQLPSLGVHHMEGHLLAPMLAAPAPKPPFVALLVSGGHTQLIDVKKLGHYQLLGESLDDAVGEAFDKTAKILGLGYPGGPALERLAKQGNPTAYAFPRPLVNKPNLDFSFSGLKTSVVRVVNNKQLSLSERADIAASFQAAVIETLVIKCQRALQQTKRQQLVIAGGVSANQKLRETLQHQLSENIFMPDKDLCTDNGAMIAFAGYLRLNRGEQDNLNIHAQARWPLTNLPAPPNISS